MKAFKRIIALLLVCVFVGAALVGCGNKDKTNSEESGSNQNNGNNNAPTETQTNIYGEPSFTGVVPVEDLDFEGEEIVVLHRDTEIINREWYKESTEDELDEAVAMRHAAVEETLNVNVTYERFPFPNYDDGSRNFNDAVYQDVIQDLHYYDVAAYFAYSGTSPLIRDYNANLLDEETFPFFDFSLP